MIRAIAVIVRGGRGSAHEAAFRILSCPADRAMEGVVFTAPREVRDVRVGEYAVVKFCPDDQFAYECNEALQP